MVSKALSVTAGAFVKQRGTSQALLQCEADVGSKGMASGKAETNAGARPAHIRSAKVETVDALVGKPLRGPEVTRGPPISPYEKTVVWANKSPTDTKRRDRPQSCRNSKRLRQWTGFS